MNTNQASNTEALFPLGEYLVTPGINALMEQGLAIHSYLQRHQCGDWGTIEEEDSAENELSLKKGYRILSAYEVATSEGNETHKIWIITEADRSVTTVMLPEEY